MVLTTFVTFIDDATRKICVYFLKQKSNVFDTFKKWRSLVKNETNLKLKCLRSDNGGSITAKSLKILCHKWNQKREHNTKYTTTKLCGREHERNNYRACQKHEIAHWIA